MAINQQTKEEYNNFTWNILLRDDLGESGKLNEIEQNLNRIRAVFDKIFSYEIVLSQMPNLENTFVSIVKNFMQEAVSQLYTSYSNVIERDSKLNYVRSTEQSIINQLMPVINYLQFSDSENNVEQKKLDSKIIEIKNKLNETEIIIEKVKAATEISGKIAEKQEIELYGNEFENMATHNKKRANNSQVYMMISLAITVVVACLFVFGKRIVLTDDSWKLSHAWNLVLEQNILLKLFLISAGGYLVAHFSRNYSAEMSMFYTNKHRQLALNSHQRILDATRSTESSNESETKNAILLQVSKTMFDIQDSGYLKNGNNPVPTTQIVETVRSGLKN